MIAELATWLVGSAIVVDSDDLAVSTHENAAIIHSDCLLNIIIENAQDNQDILLPTLQFVEVCSSFCFNYILIAWLIFNLYQVQALLDSPNERILHSMLFRYLESRGYYDATTTSAIQTWSDEEDEREKQRSSASQPMKSVTLKPNNILKVINK